MHVGEHHFPTDKEREFFLNHDHLSNQWILLHRDVWMEQDFWIYRHQWR